MKDRDLIKLLKKNGWQLDRINGSHHIFRKEGMTVSVPVHGKEVFFYVICISRYLPQRR